ASLQQGDDASQGTHPSKMGCPVCASLHAAQLTPPPAVVLPTLLSTTSHAAVVTAVAQATPQLVLLPPLRGPPQIS
ncbi:MAG TPA: DUF2946 family protein, partial [Solimonas sp.]